MFKQLMESRDDSIKLKINGNIIRLFERTLSQPSSFLEPFDSLKNVSHLYSDNKTIRLFTWDIPLADGTFQYFGFIQIRKDNNSINLIRLNDNSKEIGKPENMSLGVEKWYGAVYYKFITKKTNGKMLYTLLGWHGKDNLTTQKAIDVLQINDAGKPIFGAPVFVLNNKTVYRVLFEYSADVVMSLKYDEQKKMIVFEHLSPSESHLKGQYQFYGPDFSIDAFKFSKGKWILKEDIDARNAK